MTILGSLVIHSDRPVPEFDLPELKGLTKREGRHVGSKYNGSYREYFDVDPVEVLSPQRYKSMSVVATDSVKHDLAEALSTLDAKYEGARQLYKLNKLMADFPGEWTASVNVTNSGAEGKALSGAFYVMSSNAPLYTSLVFDSNNGSVQLVWATFDFKAQLRCAQAYNYSFFPLPYRKQIPLFIPSQSLCSRWWRLTQGFDGHRYGLLKACNAIEVLLYKNPNVKAF